MSFLLLPPELIEAVAQFLALSDVLNMRKVCKAFKDPVDNAIMRRNTHMLLDSLSFTKLPSMVWDEVDLDIHLTHSPFGASTKAVLLIALTRYYGGDFKCEGRTIPVKGCTGEFLANLKLAISDISANKIELNGCVDLIIQMTSTLLDGSDIDKQVFKFDDYLSDETCELLMYFSSLMHSKCVQLTILERTVPDELLKMLAETMKQIVVRTTGDGPHQSREGDAPIELVTSILAARCNYLDLVDVLMLTEAQANEIARAIKGLRRRVYFAAAIAAKRDVKTFIDYNREIQFEIRAASSNEMKVVEIWHRDLRVQRRVY